MYWERKKYLGHFKLLDCSRTFHKMSHIITYSVTWEFKNSRKWYYVRQTKETWIFKQKLVIVFFHVLNYCRMFSSLSWWWWRTLSQPFWFLNLDKDWNVTSFIINIWGKLKLPGANPIKEFCPWKKRTIRFKFYNCVLQQ